MDVSTFRNTVRFQYRGAVPQVEAESTSDIPVDSELIGVLTARLHWQQHLVGEFSEPREKRCSKFSL